MAHICLNCRTSWGEPSEDGFESHGLCENCFLEIVTPLRRKTQLKEGNFDCFRRSDGYCNQSECKYRNECLGLKEDIDIG